MNSSPGGGGPSQRRSAFHANGELICVVLEYVCFAAPMVLALGVIL
ncbi:MULTISPECIES: hypothetical protein [unclassified Streptomyces]